jgi:hypothetical protein
VILRDKNAQRDDFEIILTRRKIIGKMKWHFGAGDEIRTRDFLLGKLMTEK